ncbi:Radical SAM domain protein [Solidesulfovibrio fructosivorans JJ]]|uniref:Radical SAM domain protein n=1 Tax=Solidesulfovibrio fructosivorans JJ] TaxID=596151 RepID=E1K039_SOLFR|nr:radical SAM protein [Solidesulfovibrio fructosivorans]EFL50045.1 Radical SAM domain protein [Solidesulfovibrio fructosivorans JJ]]
MNLLRRLFATPRLDWVQIEVTTRCNARCGYCPRTTARTAWRDADLDWALFRRLLPQLATPYVHLQGWGEPLLHPRLPDMVREVSAAGMRAGTTSNGVLIDAAMAKTLVASGLEVIALSLAGIRARHDRLRPGAPFDRVMAALEALAEAKAAANSAKPEVHIAYLLLRADTADLEALPPLLAERGVAQVVVSSLDYVPNPALANEALLPMDAAEQEAFRARISSAAATLRQSGIRLHCRPPSLSRRASCPENPQASLVVDARGDVCPCVFTALPIQPPHPAAGSRLSFGNVGQTTLARIWREPKYAAFRAGFGKALPPGPCRICRKPFVA